MAADGTWLAAVAVAFADYLIGQAAEPPRYAEPAAASARGRPGSVPVAAAVAASHAALLPASLATLWPHVAASALPSAAGAAAGHG